MFLFVLMWHCLAVSQVGTRAPNFWNTHGTGSHHPKVGVILTCVALMFRHKATKEHSSSLLIQEVGFCSCSLIFGMCRFFVNQIRCISYAVGNSVYLTLGSVFFFRNTSDILRITMNQRHWAERLSPNS